jgi:hypothetical protein
MRGAIPPLLNTTSWRGAQLKHRDNLPYSTHKTLDICVLSEAKYHTYIMKEVEVQFDY